MANSNPWFWGSMTRQQFEQDMQKNAVLLWSGKAPPVKTPKVDIEAVRARKNALIKSGILKRPTATNTSTITASKPNV